MTQLDSPFRNIHRTMRILVELSKLRDVILYGALLRREEASSQYYAPEIDARSRQT
jgi:hypothetical protein